MSAQTRPEGEKTLGDVKDEFETILEERARDMRNQAKSGGARYRSPPTAGEHAGEDLATDGCTCRNCGRSVSQDYHRVHADNNGVLWHCGGHHGCVTKTAMKSGAGALKDFGGEY